MKEQLQLDKQLCFAMNATNLLDGISAEDCIDGDITKSIKMMSDSDIDTAHVGEYSARLKVSCRAVIGCFSALSNWARVLFCQDLKASSSVRWAVKYR